MMWLTTRVDAAEMAARERDSVAGALLAAHGSGSPMSLRIERPYDSRSESVLPSMALEW